MNAMARLYPKKIVRDTSHTILILSELDLTFTSAVKRASESKIKGFPKKDAHKKRNNKFEGEFFFKVKTMPFALAWPDLKLISLFSNTVSFVHLFYSILPLKCYECRY